METTLMDSINNLNIEKLNIKDLDLILKILDELAKNKEEIEVI